MKYIYSQDNPVIKGVYRLKRKKARDREGCYIIEGIHLITESVNAMEDLKFTLIRDSLLKTGSEEEVNSLIKLIENNGSEIYAVSDNLFDKLTDTEAPQGLLSVVRKKEWSPESFFAAKRKGSTNILVLDKLQDPGNAGTILRTAEAAGYMGALILKGTVDVYSSKVVRAAAGSLFRLPLLYVETPEDALRLLKINGKFIVATTPYCELYYYEINMKDNIALIIGNEGGGVSSVLLEGADVRVKIPMREPVESLNAAVAAGILMYESKRQYDSINGGKE